MTAPAMPKSVLLLTPLTVYVCTPADELLTTVTPSPALTTVFTGTSVGASTPTTGATTYVICPVVALVEGVTVTFPLPPVTMEDGVLVRFEPSPETPPAPLNLIARAVIAPPWIDVRSPLLFK